MNGGYDWRLGPGEYLVGLLVLVCVVAAAVICGRRLARRLVPGLQGPASWLATIVLSCSTLLVCAQLLGLFGLFTLPAYLVLLVAAATLTALTGSSRLGRTSQGQAGENPGPAGEIKDVPVEASGVASERTGRSQSSRAWAWGAALVAGIVLIRALLTAAAAYQGGMSGFDTHWYHGPFTALFLQSGSTFSLFNEIAPQYLSWFYPHGSELFQAIAILPFDRDLISPSLNLAWLAASMLAAWCIGRPFGVAPLSLVGACLILGSGLLADQPGEMRNDIPAVFFVLAMAAIALNAWRPRDRGRPGSAGTIDPGALAVIGLSAGLAAGTKLNYLATAGALVSALAMVLPRGRRLSGFGLLFGAAFLTGGYWYLRNLVHSGNPLPWITSAGPIDLPGPAQEIGGREGHGVLEYLLDAAVWRDWFLPGLREALTLAWPLIFLAAALATLALLFRAAPSVHGNHRGGGFHEPMPLWVALAVTILATVGAWLVAPASAEGPLGEPVGFVSGLRYLAPALALALALLPVVTISPRSARVVESSRRKSDRALDPPSGTEKLSPSEKLWNIGSLSERGARAGSLLGRGPVAGVVIGLACAIALVGGYALQRTYLEQRYADPDFATPGLNRAFADASRAAPKADQAPPLAVTSTRIYAFFGPDLRQPVAYVGIPEPHGGFRRPSNCREWRAAVNSTGAERLIVAWDRVSSDRPPLPPEAAWIASDQAAKEKTSGGGAAAFEISGKLDPDTCP